MFINKGINIKVNILKKNELKQSYLPIPLMQIYGYLDGISNRSPWGAFNIGLGERWWHAWLTEGLLYAMEGLATCKMWLWKWSLAWQGYRSWRLLRQHLWLGVTQRVHDWWCDGNRRHKVFRHLLKDRNKRHKHTKNIIIYSPLNKVDIFLKNRILFSNEILCRILE